MRILVIRNEPPWPLCYGGRLRCYELCRRLARRHQLLLVARRAGEAADYDLGFECWVAREDCLFDDDDVDVAAEGFRPDWTERFFGIGMRFVRDVTRVVDHWGPDIVVGMNYQSLACLARLRGIPTLLDLQDDDALHMMLELLHGEAYDKRTALKTLLAGVAFQRRYAHRVDAVALNSPSDRRAYRLYTGHRRIASVPHGVDCEHYAPRDVAVDGTRVVFWGGLSFGPNIGAIRFFAERVWPRVIAVRPQARWSVLGPGDAAPLQAVKRMPGVDWLGFVDDIRPHVTAAAAAIVPMRSGAGIKNKIMEAWAMGTPVVCTPRALGDLPGTHGDNVWLARSPRRLAEGVLRLMDDAEFRGRLGQAGGATALQHCSWDAAAGRFESLCLEVLGASGKVATPVVRSQDPAGAVARAPAG